MKKLYPCFYGLTIFMLLTVGPRAYGDDIPSVGQLESQFETQLTTRTEIYGQPKATSYYDDLVDHYEQEQIMGDIIDKCIR